MRSVTSYATGVEGVVTVATEYGESVGTSVGESGGDVAIGWDMGKERGVPGICIHVWTLTSTSCGEVVDCTEVVAVGVCNTVSSRRTG